MVGQRVATITLPSSIVVRIHKVLLPLFSWWIISNRNFVTVCSALCWWRFEENQLFVRWLEGCWFSTYQFGSFSFTVRINQTLIFFLDFPCDAGFVRQVKDPPGHHWVGSKPWERPLFVSHVSRHNQRPRNIDKCHTARQRYPGRCFLLFLISSLWLWRMTNGWACCGTQVALPIN